MRRDIESEKASQRTQLWGFIDAIKRIGIYPMRLSLSVQELTNIVEQIENGVFDEGLLFRKELVPLKVAALEAKARSLALEAAAKTAKRQLMKISRQLATGATRAK